MLGNLLYLRTFFRSDAQSLQFVCSVPSSRLLITSNFPSSPSGSLLLGDLKRVLCCAHAHYQWYMLDVISFCTLVIITIIYIVLYFMLMHSQ